jgi:hypothetical protein
MALCVLATSLFVASPARAGDDPGIALAFGVGAAIVATPATVTIVGTSVQLARDERPGLGWPIAALVSGAVSAGAGVALMATSPQGYGKIYVPQFAGGIVDLVLGAVAITTGSLVLVKRSRTAPRAALAPLVLVDARGALAPGVGVAIGSF